MIDFTNCKLDLYLELDKYDSIKKSNYYNVIKEKRIKQLSENELVDFKSFILSLSEEEIVIILIIILDDNFSYCAKNTDENQKIEDFLSDVKFEKYFDIMLSQVSQMLQE